MNLLVCVLDCVVVIVVAAGGVGDDVVCTFCLKANYLCVRGCLLSG